MKKNAVKILIDVLLSLFFALLFNTKMLGLAFHEVFGVFSGFAILIHILLNATWVKRVTMRLFDSELPRKTRLGYGLNILLLMSFIIIIVSGMLISKVLFPNLRVGNGGWFRELHVDTSYFALALIGVHIGLHWKWIAGFFKNLFKLQTPKKASAVAIVVVAILLASGGYLVVATSLTKQAANISGVSMANTQDGYEGGFDQQQFNGTPNTQTNGQQQFTGRGQKEETSGFDHQRGKSPSQNLSVIGILGLIAKYTGVMAIFAILTYYLENLLN